MSIKIKTHKKIIAAIVVLLFVISLIYSVTIQIINDKKDEEAFSPIEKLPSVGDFRGLVNIVKKTYPKTNIFSINFGRDELISSEAPESRVNYSIINNQIDGIETGDIVKTDGEFIYKRSGSWYESPIRVQIIKAYPADRMEVIHEIIYNDINPIELHLKENHLIVVADSRECIRTMNSEDTPELGRRYWEHNSSTTVILVYDITDRSDPQLLKEFYVDGKFAESRLVEDHLYVISSKYLHKEDLTLGEEDGKILPAFIDKAKGDYYEEIDYNDIKYCPGAVEPNYVIVSSINLTSPQENVKVSALLGSGNKIFSSKENFYIFGNAISHEKIYKTKIFKFSLEDGRAVYTAAGHVEGSIQNQFSMDEYEGFLRVTTATNSSSGGIRTNTANNIYILNSKMELVGKLEDLAVDKSILSTRFIGERAYMAASGNEEPLFVIEVKDPYNPLLLGELNIPGFSNYLHPYDDDHIIGFGIDVEAVDKSESEVPDVQGMRLAVFDVSNVENPKQKFSTHVGSLKTSSELLKDYRALLFSKENNLIAFPIEVYEVNEDINNEETDVIDYSSLKFVGAYIFNIDAESNFRLIGSITHINDTEGLLNYGYYNWKERITRVIYIEDVLFTISEDYVKANDRNTLREYNTLDIR
jgi:inhibitor of cysteine peptidase